MEIKAITDPSFRRYGTLLEGYDFAPLLQEMKHTPAPADQCIYQPSLGELENLSVAKQLQNRFFGELPIRSVSAMVPTTCSMHWNITEVLNWTSPSPT